MCLPTSYQNIEGGDKSSSGDSLGALLNKHGLHMYVHHISAQGKGIMDLERTREEVVAEVLKAPKRRIDNAITRLGDATALLQMHCKVS